jgi:hypothetical protein
MLLFEASFKRKNSGKLRWVTGWFENDKEATKELQSFFHMRHPNKNYNLYGGPSIIKTK